MSAKLSEKRKVAGKPAGRLEVECARLRAQVKQLTAERDGYLRSLYALTRKVFAEPVFDAEELSTMVEMDVSEIARELGLNKKDDLCPKPRMVRSKSVGPKKTARP